MTMMTTTTRKETAKKCRKSHSKLYMSMSLALAVVVLLGICTVSESFLDEARTIQNHYAIQMPHRKLPPMTRTAPSLWWSHEWNDGFFFCESFPVVCCCICYCRWEKKLDSLNLLISFSFFLFLNLFSN